jgi:hypothetical protein
MRIGLAAIGIGPGARPALLRATATSAEAAGFASLGVGEHVVVVVAEPPPAPQLEAEWTAELSQRWIAASD